MKNLAIVVCAILSACSNPLGPFAGSVLKGEVSDVPGDWTFINERKLIQLETMDDDRAYSVTTWVAATEREIYIPTSLISGTHIPAERRWVKNVTKNGNVRLKVGENIYRLKAERIVSTPQLTAARRVLLDKYEIEADEQVLSAWIYRLVTR